MKNEKGRCENGVFFTHAVGLDQRVVNLILFYFPRDLQAKKFFSDLFFLPHPTLSPLPPHSRPFPASYLSLFSIIL